MGVKERKERDFAARERAFKKAALELFEGDDWESVTVESITRRAEYAKGTIYKHFASKDDLYAQIAIDYAEQTYRALQSLPQSLPFEEALADVIDVYWSRFESEKALRRISHFVQRDDFLARLPPATRDRMSATDAKHIELITQLLIRGSVEGAVAEGKMSERIFALNAILQGALRITEFWEGTLAGSAMRKTILSAMLSILRSENI